MIHSLNATFDIKFTSRACLQQRAISSIRNHYRIALWIVIRNTMTGYAKQPKCIGFNQCKSHLKFAFFLGWV